MTTKRKQEKQDFELALSSPMADIAVRESGDIVADIVGILSSARRHVAVHINSAMTYAYWLIGRRIVVEEQKGEARSKYGTSLLKKLSAKLTGEFGKGFAEQSLRNYRQFYQCYPDSMSIRSTAWSELGWSRHKLIMRVPIKAARDFYITEAFEQQWSVKVLERNIEMRWYQRVVANRTLDENTAGNGNFYPPAAVFKDPYVFDFLKMPFSVKGKEKEVEQLLIDNLQDFLLELGKGFCFVGRQYRISTETQNFYIDLVFYNCILKCFVLFDLKTGKLTPQDIGQMDMYRRMFDDMKRTEDDNPTIGVLLCAERDETVIKYSIMKDCEKIFAAKFLPYLPTEEELITELETKRRYYQEQLGVDPTAPKEDRPDEAITETEKSNTPRQEAIYEAIKSQPGINKPALMLLVKCSKATAERCIAELSRSNKIEHRGSNRTGGYYAK